MSEEDKIEEVDEEKTLFNDMDEALLRAQQVLNGSVKLPTPEDGMGVALAKIVVIVNALVDKCKSRIII